MTRKIQIEALPVTTKFLRQKRLIQERGELALIEDGKVFNHLGYFSLRKKRGCYRGSHYHTQKVEHFYVISGKLRIELVDLDSGEKSEIRLRDGHRVTIYPRCAHRFSAQEEAQVIEYYEGIYDPEDDMMFDGFQ